jgi:L-ascorbate metabolism protein UlaG (beta-lactamase superfamily)
MAIRETMKEPESLAGLMMGVKLRWLGHAAFEITSPGGTRLLIDPFITGNPVTPAQLKDLSRYSGADKPAAILVSHSHGDHSADAPAIAKISRAPVIGMVEYISSLELPAEQGMGGNIGGAIKVGDVTVHLVPATHSSEKGSPIGFVIELASGKTIYHTGDTWIMSDMALIEEVHHPSVILICCGGGPYTQNPRVAALAIKKYFKPVGIVPMHFGTFPVLEGEAEVKKAFAGDSRVVVMLPGETRTL